MNASTRQHTPGPWYLNPRGWIVQSTGDIVTRLECSNNKEADARLISAAPTLLEALEELERLTVWVGGQNPVHDAIESAKRKARAAIAKARG